MFTAAPKLESGRAKLEPLLELIDAARHETQLSAVQRYSALADPDAHIKLAKAFSDSAEADYDLLGARIQIVARSLNTAISAVQNDHPRYQAIKELGLYASNSRYWAQKGALSGV